jgi:ABC-type transporter lipoprotein component MlaA
LNPTVMWLAVKAIAMAGLVLLTSGYIKHREHAAVSKARYADEMLLKEATQLAKDMQASKDRHNAEQMAAALKPWEDANADLFKYAEDLEKALADHKKTPVSTGWSSPVTAVIRSKAYKINDTILKGTR